MVPKRCHQTSLFLVGLLVILAATQVHLQDAGAKCAGKADVVFVLDSSTSVGHDNWKRQLDFVKSLLAPLSIGPSSDRVALVTYNTGVKLQFNLDRYLTLAEIQRALSSTKFTEGITSTGNALQLAREQVLSEVRAGAAKLVFLVTDGQTNNGADPISEAQKIKDAGAWITTVGITDKIDESALRAMSSTDEVAKVSDFSKLSTLVQSMKEKTCKMIKKPPPVKKCDNTTVTDVMIVLDSSTSVGDVNWKVQLDFVKNLLSPLNIGAKGDRVGFVTYNSDAKLVFGLTKYSSLADINRAVGSAKFTEGITATGDALAVARKELKDNGRKGVPMMVFLVTDGKTNTGVDPVAEANELKKMGADIITVGITDEIDRAALKKISSKDEVNEVSDFSKLASLIKPVQTKTCKSKKKCRPSSKAEVVIVLDSSTSVGVYNWQLQLNFVNNLLSPLNIGPQSHRIGFITYSTDAKVVFGLKKYKTFIEVAAAVKKATFIEGITATGDALKLARTKVFSEARTGVPKILFLVTDGRTNFGADPVVEAAALRKQGVQVITVGIGSKIDTTALKKMSSSGEVTKVNHFSKLTSLIKSLAAKTCAVVEKA